MGNILKKDYGFSRGRGIGLLAAAILIVFGVIASIVNLSTINPLIVGIVTLIVYLALAFYGVYGYKIPHGNLLKYIMVLFAATIIIIISYNGIIALNILNGLAVIGICYIAGRLNRYKQVMIIGCVVFALLLSSNILQKINETENFLSTNQRTQFTAGQPNETGEGPGAEDEPKEEPSEEPDTEDAPAGASIVPVGSFKSAMIAGSTLDDENETNDGDSFYFDRNDGQMPGFDGAEAVGAAPEGAQPPQENNSLEGNIFVNMGTFSTTILWGALLLIYTARYELHKEAGVEDKKKA